MTTLGVLEEGKKYRVHYETKSCNSNVNTGLYLLSIEALEPVEEAE